MVHLYKDLGKTAKKIIHDDYIDDKKVEIKTKTRNGTTYTVNGMQSGKHDTLHGDLSLKYSPMAGATVTSKLFTSGNMSHELVFDRFGVSGLKLTALGGMGTKQLGLGTVEYVSKNVAATSTVDVLAGPIAHASLTAGMHMVTAGMEAEYDTKTKEFRKYNFAVNFSDGKESEATLTLLNKGEMAKFVYSHQARPDFSVAGEFLYDRRADSKQLTMGLKYEVDRYTVLKTKINSDGLISASYRQEIRSGTSLVLSQKLDIRGSEKSTHKLGLSLIIE